MSERESWKTHLLQSRGGYDIWIGADGLFRIIAEDYKGSWPSADAAKAAIDEHIQKKKKKKTDPKRSIPCWWVSTHVSLEKNVEPLEGVYRGVHLGKGEHMFKGKGGESYENGILFATYEEAAGYIQLARKAREAHRTAEGWIYDVGHKMGYAGYGRTTLLQKQREMYERLDELRGPTPKKEAS